MSSCSGKINVLHTVLSLEVGGLEKVVCDLVSCFDKARFNIEVCCFDTIGELAGTLNNNNINVSLLRRNQKHYDTFFPFRLCKFLRRKNIHLLHMHSGTFFLGTQAGFLARTSAMIYTDHGRHLVEPKFLIGMDRFSSIFVDKIVAVSRELEEYLVNVVRLSRRKTTTIINGIDTTKYAPRRKPAHLMEEFGITLNTKVIGTVGRLAEVKDQKSMIEAFGTLNHKYPDSVLILAGDGPMKRDLQHLAMNKGLNNNRVIFAGNRLDIPDVLNLFDIFVLTSLSEGTSVSLLEAMASGIAPIVTNVGGNPSLVDHNINGIVVSAKNIDQLADNIVSLLENDERRKEYSEKASRKVREKYSVAKMVNEYENLYISLLKGKRKFPFHDYK